MLMETKFPKVRKEECKIKDTFRTDDNVWKDKRIPKEAKYIYSYIYTKCFNRYITDLNIGELQQVIKIKNKGLKRNLDILEKLKYIVYKEYANGMYAISINN